MANKLVSLGNRYGTFLAGMAFAAILLAVWMGISGSTLSAPQNELVSSIQSQISGSSRTVVDTSKPWVYDFSTLPNGKIDSRIWNVETGSTKASYNNELQTYTDTQRNVRVEDGALVLQANAERRDGKKYTSGRVDTAGSFSFLYGTLEVEAKLPRGVGTWPAAWLVPSNERYSAKDFPKATDQSRAWTLNGELDFLEQVGYLPGQNIPASHSYNALGKAPVFTPGYISNPYDEYHRYGIIKTDHSVKFTINGKVYAERKKASDSPLDWPFNQPYFLVINLSIGGDWGGKYGVDEKSAPWQYKIKSVRYTPQS